jgi:hypothetical protein
MTKRIFACAMKEEKRTKNKNGLKAKWFDRKDQPTQTPSSETTALPVEVEAQSAISLTEGPSRYLKGKALIGQWYRRNRQRMK